MSYQPSHDIVSCVAKVRRMSPLFWYERCRNHKEPDSDLNLALTEFATMRQCAVTGAPRHAAALLTLASSASSTALALAPDAQTAVPGESSA
jgi:hypothetical protein